MQVLWTSLIQKLLRSYEASTYNTSSNNSCSTNLTLATTFLFSTTYEPPIPTTTTFLFSTTYDLDQGNNSFAAKFSAQKLD
jgi:hypothetical protein